MTKQIFWIALFIIFIGIYAFSIIRKQRRRQKVVYGSIVYKDYLIQLYLTIVLQQDGHTVNSIRWQVGAYGEPINSNLTAIPETTALAIGEAKRYINRIINKEAVITASNTEFLKVVQANGQPD